MRHFIAVAVALLSLNATAAQESRSLPPFIAISTQGGFSLTVEVGNSQSLQISGDEKFLASLRTEVVEKELRITTTEREFNSVKGHPLVKVSLPALSRLKVQGAGETIINNVQGERLDIGFQGAGHLVAKGKIDYLRINAKGVGELDTKALQAKRVDVNFEGIGAVNVYASDTLNVIAKGMGDLGYYGHPKTVNKSVSGIGSVSAKD
ncbi:GIN domain-containing protein [Pseudoduganella danionis]|uniref:GIN domain-containing protein n=1 Tax=Pseudoduganella danionis TaxID=1890295 RepID=UPI0035AE70BB